MERFTRSCGSMFMSFNGLSIASRKDQTEVCTGVWSLRRPTGEILEKICNGPIADHTQHLVASAVRDRHRSQCPGIIHLYIQYYNVHTLPYATDRTEIQTCDLKPPETHTVRRDSTSSGSYSPGTTLSHSAHRYCSPLPCTVPLFHSNR